MDQSHSPVLSLVGNVYSQNILRLSPRLVRLSPGLYLVHLREFGSLSLPRDSPRETIECADLGPCGKGNSCLLRGLSYENIQRYNNSPPYMTARWPPQQIPSLNFLGCILPKCCNSFKNCSYEYVMVQFTKIVHRNKPLRPHTYLKKKKNVS